MRCKTAREHFCRHRDGIVDETLRIRLQRHLAECPACAEWCGEMEGCLKLLAALPEMETSENFEWNLKRRLLQERSRAMRNRAGMRLEERAWGLRFAAGAAAALCVTLASVLLFGLHGQRRQAGTAPPAGEVQTITEARGMDDGRLSVPSGYPAGIRYVSDQSSGRFPVEDGSARPLPFSVAVDPGIDNLIKENELLRRQLEELRRQNLIMRSMLINCANERGAKR